MNAAELRFAHHEEGGWLSAGDLIMAKRERKWHRARPAYGFPVRNGHILVVWEDRGYFDEVPETHIRALTAKELAIWETEQALKALG